MLSFFVFLLKMITTTNYNSQKISLASLKNKKSRTGNSYKNIPILYDGRKALVHLCGRFRLLPGPSFFTSPENNDFIDETRITDYSPDGYSVALEVDVDNRKLFEDFEKKIHSEVVESEQTKIKEWWGEGVKLIKECDRVYLKIYFDEGKPAPKFWKVFEKDGEEKKKRIWDTDSLVWKNIEGEIVFSIANIFLGKKAKSITCAAKEILVREIIKDEKSYFSYETDEEDDEVSE